MMLKVLLYRDWLILKKSPIGLLLTFTLFPMLMYMLLSIPLSKLIVLGIRYENWTAPGIWITTSCMLGFIYSITKVKNITIGINQLEVFLKSPVKISIIFVSIIISSNLIGLSQLICSFVITILLNNEYLSFMQVLSILFQVIPVIFFYSVLGTFIGMLIKQYINIIILVLLFFLITTFNLGTFIPLDYFPLSYSDLIKNFPITMIAINCQNIIQNDNMSYIGFGLIMVLNLLLFLITLITSYKVYKK